MAKIYDNRRHATKPFKDMEIGDIFNIGNGFFIKIDHCHKDNDEDDEFNAIDLINGEGAFFSLYEHVEPCENVTISIE